jgi:hypothetical protein
MNSSLPTGSVGSCAEPPGFSRTSRAVSASAMRGGSDVARVVLELTT